MSYPDCLRNVCLFDKEGPSDNLKITSVEIKISVNIEALINWNWQNLDKNEDGRVLVLPHPWAFIKNNYFYLIDICVTFYNTFSYNSWHHLPFFCTIQMPQTANLLVLDKQINIYP